MLEPADNTTPMGTSVQATEPESPIRHSWVFGQQRPSTMRLLVRGGGGGVVAFPRVVRPAVWLSSR